MDERRLEEEEVGGGGWDMRNPVWHGGKNTTAFVGGSRASAHPPPPVKTDRTKSQPRRSRIQSRETITRLGYMTKRRS